SVVRWSSISAWDESCTDVEPAKYGTTPYPNKVSYHRLAMSEARVQDASGGQGYRLMKQRVQQTLFCPEQSPLGSPYPQQQPFAALVELLALGQSPQCSQSIQAAADSPRQYTQEGRRHGLDYAFCFDSRDAARIR